MAVIRKLPTSDPVVSVIRDLTAGIVQNGRGRGVDNVALTAFCGALALLQADPELVRGVAAHLHIGPEIVEGWFIDDLRAALARVER